MENGRGIWLFIMNKGGGGGWGGDGNWRAKFGKRRQEDGKGIDANNKGMNPWYEEDRNKFEKGIF